MLIPSKAATIQGSYVGTVGEMREMITLVMAADAKPVPIIKRPLFQVDAALSALRDGQVVGRTVLLP